MNYRHGGAYQGHTIAYDFSINVNPLGMPDCVPEVLAGSVAQVSAYPDYECLELRQRLAAYHDTVPENILCGNGASELIKLAVEAVAPKKGMVFDPCFSGYEYALEMTGCEILHEDIGMLENMALLQEKVEQEQLDILMLCNPNNPTGNLLNPTALEQILDYCNRQEIYILLDECFIELADGSMEHSALKFCEKSPYIMVLNAFTKKFGIPGIRLGYVISSNHTLLSRMKSLQPEWSVSAIAQSVGNAILQSEGSAQDSGFLKKSRELIGVERAYMTEQLQQLGLYVYPGDANFLLVQSNRADLYEQLLDRKILIRKCSTFRGLDDSYFRICIKTRPENDELLKALKEILL